MLEQMNIDELSILFNADPAEEVQSVTVEELAHKQAICRAETATNKYLIEVTDPVRGYAHCVLYTGAEKQYAGYCGMAWIGFSVAVGERLVFGGDIYGLTSPIFAVSVLQIT